MLLIPFLAVLVAASLGKPENYSLPNWTKVLYLPTFVLVLLVVTNDLHQMVFCFPADAVIWKDNEYTRGIGYFLVVGFMAVCALAAVGIMLYKCRARGGHKTVWLPLIFLPISLVYSVLYAFYIEDHTSLLYYLAGDVTVTLCLLFSGMLESCLLTGLIQTNTGYDRLFAHVLVGMQITDENGQVRYCSKKAKMFTEQERVQAQNAGTAGFLYDENTVLKAHAIRGGQVIWQEDITEAAKVKRELENVKEELSARNEILREQYRRDAQRYRMEEQNRLYDLVQQETQKQLKQIDELAAAFSEASKEQNVPMQKEREKKDLLRILLLATYIKRHKDMVIAADRNPLIPITMLGDAIGESCSNLTIGGIDSNIYQTKRIDSIAAKTLCDAYACFEDILENLLDTLTYLLVSISYRDGRLYLSLTAECEADLTNVQAQYQAVGFETNEDGWTVHIPLTGGEHA